LAVYDGSKDEKEINSGVLAMLPDWCQKINNGTTVEDLHKQIHTVRKSQRQFLTHFSDKKDQYIKDFEAETYVDKVWTNGN